MPDDSRVGPAFDPATPTAARMYDYYLDGKDNYPADRAAAKKLIRRFPEVPLVAKANRAFLGRAVRFLAGETGITQFLDLGTGLPTRGNVDQVAQATAPGARVVCVDNDAMVVTHARALKTSENTGVIDADLCDPDTILSHPETRRLIDFTQPLGILFVSVLHFVTDAEATASVAAFTGAAAPGSYLVLSHGTSDPDPKASELGTSVYASTAYRSHLRTRKQILRFFDGLELLAPGLVPVQQWRPDTPEPPAAVKAWIIGGAGRKRA